MRELLWHLVAWVLCLFGHSYEILDFLRVQADRGPKPLV
jgi:hypothetical protein